MMWNSWWNDDGIKMVEGGRYVELRPFTLVAFLDHGLVACASAIRIFTNQYAERYHQAKEVRQSLTESIKTCYPNRIIKKTILHKAPLIHLEAKKYSGKLEVLTAFGPDVSVPVWVSMNVPDNVIWIESENPNDE